jgi:putative hydrolase of the HAD superfamily
VKYLIWDFDGTLGYRPGMWSGALVEVVRRAFPGSRTTAEDVRPYLQSGFPWHHPERPHPHLRPAAAWWEALCPVFERAFRCGAGLSAYEAQRVARHVRAVYVNPARWRVFEDAVPCLQTCARQGWQHLLLSNHVPELPMILMALGLAPSFTMVFNSATTGVEKPHPQAFRNVLTALQGAETLWMVGDSVTADIAGAHAVGLRAVLVRTQPPHVGPWCATLAELPRRGNTKPLFMRAPPHRRRATGAGQAAPVGVG